MSEELEKLKKELNNPNAEITIVNTPTAQVKKLEAQLEEERTLREDYETKLKLIGEKKLEEKLKELNVPEYDQPYFRANPEKLEAYAKGKRQVSSGRGNVGLRQEDLIHEQNHGKRGYNSYSEMIRDVTSKSAQGDPEMQEVKKKLWEKMLKEMKENPEKMLNKTVECPNFIEDVLKLQNEKWRKDHEGRKERD